jgi:hypothetical protein
MQLVDDLLVETRRRFLNAPEGGRSDEVEGQPETLKHALDAGRLIASNADPQAAFMERAEAGTCAIAGFRSRASRLRRRQRHY